MGKLTNKEEFVAYARKIHGNLYGYDNFAWSNRDTKSNITCFTHNEDFPQSPQHHIYRKQGCPRCAIDRRNISDTEIDLFLQSNNLQIKRAENCINATTIVNWECLVCNQLFQKSFRNLRKKPRCLHCVKRPAKIKKSKVPFIGKIITAETFKNDAINIHGNKYDYSKVTGGNAKHKETIICIQHSEFFQNYDKHITRKQGCRKCTGLTKLTQEDVIARANVIHDNKYSYLKLKFVNVATNGIITCDIHGDFEQNINNHLRGSGCEECRKIGENEKLLGRTLAKWQIMYEKQYCIRTYENQKKAYQIDFYIPEHNLFIEYNGGQHYAPTRFGGIPLDVAETRFEVQKLRDQRVRQYCIDKNIQLLEIDGRKYVRNNLVEYLKKQLISLGIMQSTNI